MSEEDSPAEALPCPLQLLQRIREQAAEGDGYPVIPQALFEQVKQLTHPFGESYTTAHLDQVRTVFAEAVDVLTETLDSRESEGLWPILQEHAVWSYMGLTHFTLLFTEEIKQQLYGRAHWSQHFNFQIPYLGTFSVDDGKFYFYIDVERWGHAPARFVRENKLKASFTEALARQEDQVLRQQAMMTQLLQLKEDAERE